MAGILFVVLGTLFLVFRIWMDVPILFLGLRTPRLTFEHQVDGAGWDWPFLRKTIWDLQHFGFRKLGVLFERTFPWGGINSRVLVSEELPGYASIFDYNDSAYVFLLTPFADGGYALTRSFGNPAKATPVVMEGSAPGDIHAMVRQHAERVESCLARGQQVKRPLGVPERLALARSYYTQPHNLSTHRKLAFLAGLKLATAVAALVAILQVVSSEP